MVYRGGGEGWKEERRKEERGKEERRKEERGKEERGKEERGKEKKREEGKGEGGGRRRREKERRIFRCSEEWLLILMNKKLGHFHALRRKYPVLSHIVLSELLDVM